MVKLTGEQTNMTREAQHKLCNLCEKMTQAGYEAFKINRIRELIDVLHKNHIQGINKFIQKLSHRIADKEAYMDIFVEGQFAVTLAKNKFSEIKLEWSSQGPDIEAVYNRQTICFEVRRRRPAEDEWSDSFEPNHVKPDCSQRIVSKIQDKLKQLQDGSINIVVFWSSTMKVMSGEMTIAYSNIQHEIDKDPERYHKLSGILFTEMEGYDLHSLKQYYLFRNSSALRPISFRLAKKLEYLHSNRKEARKVKRRLEATFKRLHVTGI